jgi:hypothetical protein
LEAWAQASRDESLVEFFVSFEEAFGCSIFESLYKDVVAVIIVQDHNIVVASAADGNKLPGLIGVNLTGGIKCGDVALVGFGLFAGWKRIGMGFIGWIVTWGIRGDGMGSFGRTLVFTRLVKMAFDHGDRGWWVRFEGFGGEAWESGDKALAKGEK